MKKFILLTLFLCSFLISQAKAQDVIPTADTFTITAAANTSGITTPTIDCSQSGQEKLSILIISPSTSTVNIQSSTNKQLWSNFSATPILNAASGVAYFTLDTSIPFWHVTSATTGVAFVIQWGCK